jgi:hypothetical protein
MKSASLIAFPFLLVFCSANIARNKKMVEKNIEIQLVIPDKSKQIASAPCLDIQLLIINHTDTVASFFEDWNSWGYFNIYFEVKVDDSIYRINKRQRDWPKNFPSFKVLFPGDTLKLSFDKKLPYCDFYQFSNLIQPSNNSNTSIRAIYQLDSLTLFDAHDLSYFDSSKMIKYKYKWIPKHASSRKGDGEWKIVDSLFNPVPLMQTFVLSRMQSIEYKLY